MSYEKYDRSEMPSLSTFALVLGCIGWVISNVPTLSWMVVIAFVGAAGLWYQQEPGSAYALLAIATAWVYAVRYLVRENEMRMARTVREYLLMNWCILRGPLFWAIIVATLMGSFYVPWGWRVLLVGLALLEISIFFIHRELRHANADELSMLAKGRLPR